MFFSWITAGVIFLFVTYTFKLKSFWRLNKISRQRDIWQHKDTDDFLNYLKFEYKNFCMGACFFLMTLFFIFKTALDFNDELPDKYVNIVMVYLTILVMLRWIFMLFMQRL